MQAWLDDPSGRPKADDVLETFRAMELPLDPDQTAARPAGLYHCVRGAAMRCDALMIEPERARGDKKTAQTWHPSAKRPSKAATLAARKVPGSAEKSPWPGLNEK